MQLRKNQLVADAKKQVREEMRAEREQRQATLDIQSKAAGHSYNNRGITTSRDMGRRTPSSGSFFSKPSLGGGLGSGLVNGGNTGRAGK